MWWGQSGPIEIEARTEGGHAVFGVARGGGGPEDPEAAFSAAEGSGGRITLHMARRVAEALGGTLTAEGGETTRFRLSLPA